MPWGPSAAIAAAGTAPSTRPATRAANVRRTVILPPSVRPPSAAARLRDRTALKNDPDVAERSLKSLHLGRFPPTVLPSAAEMEFRVLGPLEVESDGRLLPIGSRQPRIVLALLLLNANRVVSRDRLVDAIWGDDPPERAANALQVYVSQLRKALGREVIVTQQPGYLVQVAEG